MSKIIVIYQSKHGSTKEYANWIAEDLEAEAFDYEQDIDFEESEIVILGSSIYKEKVVLSKFIKKHWNELKNKKVFLFTVSVNAHKHLLNTKEILQNFPKEIQKHLDVFPLKANIKLVDLNFFEKAMFKLMSAKETDHVKEENIGPIIEAIKKYRGKNK